jgi:hypothetical protein
VATKPSASPLSCSRCGTAMKDVVTIAPLAGDPGLWTSHERIGPAEPALRRLSCCALPVKTLEVPATLFRSGALVPCAGSEQTRTVPSPPPGRVPSRCSAVRAAHQPPPDDSSISTFAPSGRVRRQGICGYRCRDESAVRAGGAGMACACTRAEQVEREQHGAFYCILSAGSSGGSLATKRLTRARFSPWYY